MNTEDFSDEWYIITDLNELINSSRVLVFNNFGKHESQENDLLSFSLDDADIKELDSILSFEESELIVKNLIKKQYNKALNKSRYLLSDKIYLQIIYDLNDRMVSNILNGLVNKGLVETAYDEVSNDFVFWIKEKNAFKEENSEKPETD